MGDDEFYMPNRPPAPPRQPKPGELLFEFSRTAIAYRVELRDHGEHVVEAQYFVNGELWQACRFLDRMWATRLAERVRAEVLRGQHAWP